METSGWITNKNSVRCKSCPPLEKEQPNHDEYCEQVGGKESQKQKEEHEREVDSGNEDDKQKKEVEPLVRNKSELLTLIALMLALFSALCTYAMVAPILPLEVMYIRF